MSRKLLYIEPQQDYGAIVQKYLKPYAGRSERPVIFLPSPAHIRALTMEAAKADLDISGWFVQYRTIDASLDNYLYGMARGLGQKLINILRSTSAALANDIDLIFGPLSRRPARLVLMDRIVLLVRGPVMLLEHAKEIGRGEVHVVLKTSSRFHLMLPLFERSHIAVHVHTEHLSPARAKFIRNNPARVPLKPSKFYRDISTFSLDHLPDTRCSLFVLANLKDRMYRLAALPLIRKLDTETRVTVLSTHLQVAQPRELAEDLHQTKVWNVSARQPGLTDASIEIPEIEQILKISLTRFILAAKADIDPTCAGLADLVADWLGRNLLSYLMQIRHFVAVADKVAPLATAVAVLPGRYMEAGVLVEAARRHRVPTFEIQSGTITSTKRFIAPLADRMLCTDPYSKKVYCDYLGRKPSSVIFVGGPKIDFELSPVRTLTQEDARAQLQRFGMPRDGTVVMLAPQPIGAAQMGTIAEMLMRALWWKRSYTLFIKQHPNEDANYEKAYRNAAKRLFFNRLVISKAAPVLPAIIASDIVCTYYSTAGLEAFCLKRPVICVNPFDHPLPFDLPDLGVAREAKTVKELGEAIRMAGTTELKDPGLGLLQDGNSTERCAKLILRSIAPPQPTLSSMAARMTAQDHDSQGDRAVFSVA